RGKTCLGWFSGSGASGPSTELISPSPMTKEWGGPGWARGVSHTVQGRTQLAFSGVWTFCGLSRRDYATKPRVARNELPWVGCGQRHNPIGVATEPKEIYAAIAVGR